MTTPPMTRPTPELHVVPKGAAYVTPEGLDEHRPFTKVRRMVDGIKYGAIVQPVATPDELAAWRLEYPDLEAMHYDPGEDRYRL